MATIVVEGPIGVGKTSLARYLADELGARVVLEVVEENPFLAGFYDDPRRYAFQAQVFFLLSRFRQHMALSQEALFQRDTVSDYLFEKDFIFASLTLAGAEWELYRQLYGQLEARVTPPDLVVYLRADPDLLLERIARRGRPFERGIRPDYLARITAAYDSHFRHVPYPVHVVEAAELDYVASEEDRTALVSRVVRLARAA